MRNHFSILECLCSRFTTSTGFMINRSICTACNRYNVFFIRIFLIKHMNMSSGVNICIRTNIIIQQTHLFAKGWAIDYFFIFCTGSCQHFHTLFFSRRKYYILCRTDSSIRNHFWVTGNGNNASAPDRQIFRWFGFHITVWNRNCIWCKQTGIRSFCCHMRTVLYHHLCSGINTIAFRNLRFCIYCTRIYVDCSICINWCITSFRCNRSTIFQPNISNAEYSAGSCRSDIKTTVIYYDLWPWSMDGILIRFNAHFWLLCNMNCICCNPVSTAFCFYCYRTPGNIHTTIVAYSDCSIVFISATDFCITVFNTQTFGNINSQISSGRFERRHSGNRKISAISLRITI